MVSLLFAVVIVQHTTILVFHLLAFQQMNLITKSQIYKKKLKEKKKVKALSEMNQTLLIFTANWCESCQYTYSMWLKFANRFSTEKLKIVEVDTSRHDAIARKFQVNFRDGK